MLQLQSFKMHQSQKEAKPPYLKDTVNSCSDILHTLYTVTFGKTLFQ